MARRACATAPTESGSSGEQPAGRAPCLAHQRTCGRTPSHSCLKLELCVSLAVSTRSCCTRAGEQSGDEARSAARSSSAEIDPSCAPQACQASLLGRWTAERSVQQLASCKTLAIAGKRSACHLGIKRCVKELHRVRLRRTDKCKCRLRRVLELLPITQLILHREQAA